MNIRAPAYKRHRFPPDIIQSAMWLYFRFNLSHCDIEDLRAQRGFEASRESIGVSLDRLPDVVSSVPMPSAEG